MIGFARSLSTGHSKPSSNPCLFIIDPLESTKPVKDVKDHITVIVAFIEATMNSVKNGLTNYFKTLDRLDFIQYKVADEIRKYFPPRPQDGVFEYLFDKGTGYPKKIVVKGASSSTLEKLRKIVSSNPIYGWKNSDNTYKDKIVKTSLGMTSTTFANFYFDDTITYEVITALAFEFQNHCNSSAYVVCVNDTSVKVPHSNCISCFPNLMNTNQRFSLIIKGNQETAADDAGKNLKIAYEDVYKLSKKYKQEFVILKPIQNEPSNGKYTFDIICKNNEDALNLFESMKSIKDIELDNYTKPIKDLNSWVHDGEYAIIYNYKKKSAQGIGLPEDIDLATLNQKRIDNFHLFIFNSGEEPLFPEFFKCKVIRPYSPEDGRAYFKFDFPVMAKIFCCIHNYRAKVSSALVIRENLMETKNFNLPEPLPFSLPADTYINEPDVYVPTNELRNQSSKNSSNGNNRGSNHGSNHGVNNTSNNISNNNNSNNKGSNNNVSNNNSNDSSNDSTTILKTKNNITNSNNNGINNSNNSSNNINQVAPKVEDNAKNEALIATLKKEIASLKEKDSSVKGGDIARHAVIKKKIDEKLLDETVIIIRQDDNKFLEMQQAMIELLKQPPIYCTKLENYFQTKESNCYLYLHKKPRIITIHEFLLNFKDSHKFIQMIMDGPVYMLMTSNPFSIQTCRVFCGIVIYLLAASSDTTKDKADVFPLFLENAELIHIVLDGIHTKKEPTTVFFGLLAQFGTKIEFMQNLGFLVLVKINYLTFTINNNIT